jgi:hypothetical protein
MTNIILTFTVPDINSSRRGTQPELYSYDN